MTAGGSDQVDVTFLWDLNEQVIDTAFLITAFC
jgi:hypothetical protein